MLLTMKLDELKRSFKRIWLPMLLVLTGCTTSQVPTHTPTAIPKPHSQVPVSQAKLVLREPVPAMNIWDRIREGFALQEHIGVNPRIERHRLFYTANPATVERASQRSEPYIYHVVEELEKNHVPLEIALLPVIESSYDPLAYSPANAVGLWQFIPSTGRNFNLRQTSIYDGRRDLLASTQAAINYLTRLHRMFDEDWLLALAAYNAGEGTVSRAIARNKKLGLPTDYWNLQLPKETQDYVPKLLALSQIVLSPEAFGTRLSPIANEPYFEKVAINRAVDLTQVAKIVDVEFDELYKLNAGFKRKVTENAPQHLLVPTDKADLLSEKLASLPAAPLVRWQPYQVKRGDSLHTIARRYRLEVDTLKQINDLSSNRLRIGQTLNLPADATAMVSPTAPRQYRVKQGDNLSAIAKAHGVSVNELRRWNGLNSSALKIGQLLKLERGQSRTTYTVQRGDSLYSIAQRFNVRVNALKQWNPRVSSQLKPGQTLAVHVEE